MSPDFSRALELVGSGLADRAYPGATIEIGAAAGPLCRAAFGRQTYDPASVACRLDTVFDLASLTKVIATTSIATRAVSRGELSLDAPVARYVDGWRHAAVTLHHLLDHSSGLPAHVEVWKSHRGRDAFRTAIVELRLAYEPGTQSVYSDVGFMALGFALERALARPLDRLIGFLPMPADEVLTFRPPGTLVDRIAPTEGAKGSVHDENAQALDGVAAHAGLFGTVGAVGAFARLVLATFRGETALGTSAVMVRFASKTGVPGSSRALGWDTMLPTSSCGTKMSPTAIGHVGFTGTSLWIDYERDVYVALLTNRVHPTRENQKLTTLRPRIHDEILTALP